MVKGGVVTATEVVEMSVTCALTGAVATDPTDSSAVGTRSPQLTEIETIANTEATRRTSTIFAQAVGGEVQRPAEGGVRRMAGIDDSRCVGNERWVVSRSKRVNRSGSGNDAR